MDLGLKGLNALVTGSSKGLGFATARVLLAEGANVVINSRSKDNVAAALEKLKPTAQSGTAYGLTGDITIPDFVSTLLDFSIKKLGGLDILVTNAGGPPPGKFMDLSHDQWEQAIDLSFKSHILLIKAALPYLLESKKPSVLAVTSFTIKNPLDNLILSNTVRAATAALMKSLSIELGNQNIRFNAILPGWTTTERVNALLQDRAQRNQTSVEVEKQQIAGQIPLGRMATPLEFAHVAAFICSPAASYVNGTMITVDGGITKGLL